MLLRNVNLNANEIRANGPGGMTLLNGVNATVSTATVDGLQGRIVVAELPGSPSALVVTGDIVVTNSGQFEVTASGTATTTNLYAGVTSGDTLLFVSGGATLTVTNLLDVNQPGNPFRVDGELTAGQINVSSGTLLYLSDFGGISALTVGTNNGDSVIAAVIANSVNGPGSITKVGTGTLELSDFNNTYTGGTTVNGGTLLVNGSTGSGTVTVNNGATLGGMGMAGPTVINAGGGIAPGSSAGLLDTGDLTFTGDADYLWELGEFESDSVFVNGTLAFNSVSPYTVRLFDLGERPDPLASYELYNAASLTGFNPANWSIDYGTTGWSGGMISQNGNQIVMTGLAPPVIPGDLDNDGDADLDDYGLFAGCMAGPDVTTPPPGCDPADFALADLQGADGDVDVGDLATFQEAFTGP
jgi:autotransporter-associated beta strand protein